MPDIALFDALYTARALRRLKPDPVPEALITRVLDAAIRVPSGGDLSGTTIYARLKSKGKMQGILLRMFKDRTLDF